MGLGAGQIANDEDLAGLTAGIAVSVTNTTSGSSSIGTVASGFTVNDARVATALNGALVHLDLYINTTSAITASGGNIADTKIYTVDAAYIPSHTVSCVWGNGTVGGEANVATDGTVNMRSAGGTVGAGSNIRLTAVYMIG